MNVNWYWYVSMPKLNSLENENLSWFGKIFRMMSFSLEFTLPKVKSTVSIGSKPAVGIGRRLKHIEKAIRRSYDVPTASGISSKRPLFFEFEGYADKFIQGGFTQAKPADLIGEDFYPSGAFVMAGIEKTTGVILIGNANNMFGSSSKDASISQFSQAPVVALHRFAENKNYDRSPDRRYYKDVIIPSVVEVYDRCYPYSFVMVKALAIFGAQVPMEPQHSESKKQESIPDEFDVHGAFKNIENVVIGSPIYIKQLASS